jgi:hypothetical protein
MLVNHLAPFNLVPLNRASHPIYLPPIWKRKAPRFRILKKCMTRLEALRLIRNGPTHPAMMHDRRERAQNGVSLLGEAHIRIF